MQIHDRFGNTSTRPYFSVARRLCVFLLTVGFAPILLTSNLRASEDVPHAPFAQWADVPEKGQFVAGLFYDESEAYHIWAKNSYQNVTVHSNGERYGIDINQGWATLQYGITERWAADLSMGYTTLGWRDFDINQQPRSTTGLMDTAFGIRYQAFNEATAPSPWIPTLTLRAGGIIPGSYDQHIAFSPGARSAAVEPEVLARKHFGWPGFGVYGDVLFRWNRTTANDQYIAAVGLFQQIKNWELQAGYRRLGSISGDDIVFDPTKPWTIQYPVSVRENNDTFEAGFNYTLPKRKWQFGFYSRTVFDGANSDKKFWFGAYINIPFSIFKSK